MTIGAFVKRCFKIKWHDVVSVICAQHLGNDGITGEYACYCLPPRNELMLRFRDSLRLHQLTAQLIVHKFSRILPIHEHKLISLYEEGDDRFSPPLYNGMMIEYFQTSGNLPVYNDC